MVDIKKYPILNWVEKEYLSKVLGFLIFLVIAGVIYYIFRPEKFHVWLIFAQIQTLILYAIVVRQKLLLQYSNNIIEAIKSNILNKITFNTESVEKTIFPSWNIYENKFKNLKTYSSNFLIAGTIFIALYTRDPNLTFKIGCFPTVIVIYFVYYIKSLYLQSYLKETISTNESILSRIKKNVSIVKIGWLEYDRKNIIDWIVSGILVLLGGFFYLFKCIDLFSAIIIFFWFAFLYPAIRLTIDLNIQFNRFSSALEKATSDLFTAKDTSTK